MAACPGEQQSQTRFLCGGQGFAAVLLFDCRSPCANRYGAGRARDGEGDVTELRVWEFGMARPHMFAELVAPDDVVDQLEIVAQAIDAVFALGDGLFEPLAVDVSIAYFHDEYGLAWRQPAPSAPFHQLRGALLPERVEIREIWTGTRVAQRKRLDRASVLDWVRAIFEQEPRRPGFQPGFTWLNIGGVRARLPVALHDRVTGDLLPVTIGGGTLNVPVERFDDALWVAGPDEWHSDSAPFDVTISQEGGSLDLSFTQNWSPWIDDDGAGRPDVGAAFHRLSALGWQVGPATESVPQMGRTGRHSAYYWH